MVELIKAIDPIHPVTIGLHGDGLHRDNGFRVDKVYAHTDIAVMHSYPMYTPWARQPLDPDFVPFTCALTAALAVGVACIYGLWRWPEIGLPLLVPTSLLVPVTISTGAQTGVNAALLLAMAMLGMWVVDMVARKREVTLAPSSTVVPLLGWMIACLLSFGFGRLNWLPGGGSPLTGQLGGLGLLILLPAAGRRRRLVLRSAVVYYFGRCSLSPVNGNPGTGQDSNGRRELDACRTPHGTRWVGETGARPGSSDSRSGCNPPERASSARTPVPARFPLLFACPVNLCGLPSRASRTLRPPVSPRPYAS